MVAEDMDVAEAEALAALRAWPLVKDVRVLPAKYGKQAGYHIHLWCRSAHAGKADGAQLSCGRSARRTRTAS